jgi:PPOX class probable F420-dependent enzyme
MPGYDLAAADAGAGLLPWSWAEERLRSSHAYWVATVRPDGRPHAMAVWGAWHDGRLVFSTGGRSRKARNLAAEARCTVTTGDPTEPVVVEGVAEVLGAAGDAARRAYEEKYGSSPPDPLFAVRPHVVFGLIEDSFTDTATRWTFV